MTDGVNGTVPADSARLHRLLGGEPTAWLVQRARDRLAAGRPLTVAVTLTDATAAQRRAVERLTGRPPRSGTSLSVSLPEVDRVLRESGTAPGGLAEAVVPLTGPVRNLPFAAEVGADARRAAWAELGNGCPPLVCVGGQPSAAVWRLLDLLAAGGAQRR